MDQAFPKFKANPSPSMGSAIISMEHKHTPKTEELLVQIYLESRLRKNLSEREAQSSLSRHPGWGGQQCWDPRCARFYCIFWCLKGFPLLNLSGAAWPQRFLLPSPPWPLLSSSKGWILLTPSQPWVQGFGKTTSEGSTECCPINPALSDPVQTRDLFPGTAFGRRKKGEKIKSIGHWAPLSPPWVIRSRGRLSDLHGWTTPPLTSWEERDFWSQVLKWLLKMIFFFLHEMRPSGMNYTCSFYENRAGAIRAIMFMMAMQSSK